jgi:hypothetical protein
MSRHNDMPGAPSLPGGVGGLTPGAVPTTVRLDPLRLGISELPSGLINTRMYSWSEWAMIITRRQRERAAAMIERYRQIEQDSKNIRGVVHVNISHDAFAVFTGDAVDLIHNRRLAANVSLD